MRIENHAMVRVVGDDAIGPGDDIALPAEMSIVMHHDLLPVGLELMDRVAHVPGGLAGNFVVVDQRRLLAVGRTGAEAAGEIKLRADVVIAADHRVRNDAVKLLHRRPGVVPLARQIVVHDVAVLHDELDIAGRLVVDQPLRDLVENRWVGRAVVLRVAQEGDGKRARRNHCGIGG